MRTEQIASLEAEPEEIFQDIGKELKYRVGGNVRIFDNQYMRLNI